MNLDQLLKHPKTVLLRPLPLEVTRDGLSPADYPWRVEPNTSEPRTAKLTCLATPYTKTVDASVVYSFMREPRAGGIDGILNLRAQVFLRGNDMLLEPIRHTLPSDTYGEFVEDAIVRNLREYGRATLHQLVDLVRRDRINLANREFLRRFRQAPSLRRPLPRGRQDHRPRAGTQGATSRYASPAAG